MIKNEYSIDSFCNDVLIYTAGNTINTYWINTSLPVVVVIVIMSSICMVGNTNTTHYHNKSQSEDWD